MVDRWDMKAAISTVDIAKSESGMYVKYADYVAECERLRDALGRAIKVIEDQICHYCNAPITDYPRCGLSAHAHAYGEIDGLRSVYAGEQSGDTLVGELHDMHEALRAIRDCGGGLFVDIDRETAKEVLDKYGR